MSKLGLLAYAALGLPLAMAALPVYVAAPQFYGSQLGVDLAALGLVLMLARLVDTAQDPFLGRLVDAWQRHPQAWPRLLLLGGGVLALALFALFTPPHWSQTGLLAWLAVCLVLVFTAHSAVNICYLAWGARLSDEVSQRATVTAWREGAGLFGVILAAILPLLLARHFGARDGYSLFAIVFAGVLALALLVTVRWAPAPQRVASPQPSDWRTILAPAAIRRLLLVYLLNSLAVAIPATLVLFYVDDVIGAPGHAGFLLAAYFVAGGLALPGWVWLARRLGKARAWWLGMALSCLAFCWAAGLGRGDIVQFAVVCLLSGAALGADLALPPALLADLIPPERRRDTGLYFGIWAMLGKLALAVSAGLALPLLSGLGYSPGRPGGAPVLALVYAGLPCVLKLLCAALLHAWQGRFLSLALRENTP